MTQQYSTRKKGDIMFLNHGVTNRKYGVNDIQLLTYDTNRKLPQNFNVTRVERNPFVTYDKLRHYITFDYSFEWSDGKHNELVLHKITTQFFAGGSAISHEMKLVYVNDIVQEYSDSRGNEWKHTWTPQCPFNPDGDPLGEIKEAMSNILKLYDVFGDTDIDSLTTYNEKRNLFLEANRRGKIEYE